MYFEDFTPGRVFELGSVEVTEAEIVEFATRYDPQPFHIDPDAASAGPYGGLIASGWHTTAMFMRLIVDHLIGDSSGQGSPGMEEVRWLAPVRPGDVLTGRATVVWAEPSSKRPDRGTVMMLSEMVNQDGLVVLSMRGRGLYGRRSA